MTPRSSRRRKTRYLSLRRRLAAAAPIAPMVAAHSSPSPSSDHGQLILFPLHPDTALLDPHDDQLSRFFPNDDAVTLHSLLGPPSAAAATATDNSSSAAATPLSEDPRSPSSSSANYSACSSSYGNGSAVVGGLARAALRGRERWWAEEEGEAASGGVAADLLAGAWRRLALRLDYEGILSAWSDKSPLFVEGEAFQIVPDVHNTASGHQYATPVFVDVAGCRSGGAGLWTVPDGPGDGVAAAGEGEEGCAGDRASEEGGEGEEKKDRKARVMRYKEKRRRRLFSKRIRYEVRKLNAEKRPRVKSKKSGKVKNIDGVTVLTQTQIAIRKYSALMSARVVEMCSTRMFPCIQ